MKPFAKILPFFLLTAAFFCFFGEKCFAQQTNPAEVLTADKAAEKDMSSVVMILTGKGNGILDKLGTGVIVRSDGVVLTAYHVVKDASQLQIRLKNGEIFDKVDLLGFDERRDAAALKISATNLPAVSFAAENPAAGGRVFVISNPQTLGWTVDEGLLNAERMADEIPDAGKGFRILQFSAPVSRGSSGGLLTDDKGQAIGLITGSLSGGQNLNFAVPFASVDGLASATQSVMSFSRGDSLELPQAVRPPTAVDALAADPKTIIKNAKLFYIWSNSELINSDMMQTALLKTPEFAKWNYKIVNKMELADIVINVEHALFTWDYRYSMTDRRTNVVLAAKKVTVWDGGTASKKFAKFIVAHLKEMQPPVETEKAEKKIAKTK